MDASQAEDAALRTVFGVTLSEDQATESMVYLGSLAQVPRALVPVLLPAVIQSKYMLA